jgi:3-methyladenine DNA glycosylase AlkD
MATQVTVKAALKRHANPAKVSAHERFFRTGKGEYGEGDRFIAVSVPNQRTIAKQFKDLSLGEIAKLLDDKIHECRLTALLILCEQFPRADTDGRQKIADLYIEKMDRVNNWDLVDTSAYKLLGAHLEDKDRSLLDELADSDDLWRQRIAIVATYHFIKQGDFLDTLRIARTLVHHEHDLIHKAVGWMLREVGNRDQAALERFLKGRYHKMPRTMLRYAIERLPEALRKRYLRGEV